MVTKGKTETVFNVDVICMFFHGRVIIDLDAVEVLAFKLWYFSFEQPKDYGSQLCMEGPALATLSAFCTS